MKILEILKKFWWILLIVVLAIVVLVGKKMIDDWNKPSIKVFETSLIIEEVKQISELISAQFYGEVYADLFEIYSLKAEEIKKIDSDRTMPRKTKEAEKKKIYEVYKRLANYKEGAAPVLVYIGRGYVNAIIDLKNIKYEVKEDKKAHTRTISIQLDSPKIQEPIINAWFDKDEKILGYEIFIGEKDTKLSDQEVQEVKMLCGKKLKEEAEKSNIIPLAKDSAVDSIKNFFTLLGYKVEVVFNKDI